VTPPAVGSWVHTPEGLGRVLSVRPETRWIFRKPHTTVWVRVELMDGTRFQLPIELVRRS
jgi:hypothetical protein